LPSKCDTLNSNRSTDKKEERERQRERERERKGGRKEGRKDGRKEGKERMTRMLTVVLIKQCDLDMLFKLPLTHGSLAVNEAKLLKCDDPMR
jgi:flagellar biosynthesis/type III secretory pathway protein FliH